MMFYYYREFVEMLHMDGKAKCEPCWSCLSDFFVKMCTLQCYFVDWVDDMWIAKSKNSRRSEVVGSGSCWLNRIINDCTKLGIY